MQSSLQELLCWPDDDDRVDVSPRTLPSGPAHCLLTPPTLPYLVVVYSEGRVGTVGVVGGEGGGGEVTLVKRVTHRSRPK